MGKFKLKINASIKPKSIKSVGQIII